jgi:hypothetical protein
VAALPSARAPVAQWIAAVSSTEAVYGRPSLSRRSPRLATIDEAFMEPRGRNRSQPVANPIGAKAAETSETRCRGFRPVAERSAW